MGKWKELAEPLDDRDAPTMKPTQEQVIAWAREAGFATSWTEAAGEALECFATLAYEAGRKDENEACAELCEYLPADEFVDRSEATIWDLATLDCAAAIRARREQ